LLEEKKKEKEGMSHVRILKSDSKEGIKERNQKFTESEF
jgi:hypothetical protein